MRKDKKLVLMGVFLIIIFIFGSHRSPTMHGGATVMTRIMRLLLSIFFFLNLSSEMQAQVTFKHYSLKKALKMEYVAHDIEEPGCLDADEDGEIDPIILFEIGGVDPAASDERKQKVIERLDQQLEALKVYADCPETKTIIIQLAEGTFLKASDEIEPYTRKYSRKGHALNAKRFKKRYLKKLGAWLPGKKIILTDWNW